MYLKICIGVVISQSAICPKLSEVAIEGELLKALVNWAHGSNEDVDCDLCGGAPQAWSESHVIPGLLKQHIQCLGHLPARLLLIVHGGEAPFTSSPIGQYSYPILYKNCGILIYEKMS